MLASLTDFVTTLKDNRASLAYENSYKTEHNIPFYDGDIIRKKGIVELSLIKQEWIDCWTKGAGVLIISDFYSDKKTVDEMSDVIYRILDDEQSSKNPKGDHFAKEGKNKRVWNALEKSAIKNPQAFINYYSNSLLGLVCEAWLGPGYTMTAQVNLVPPNSNTAQAPHRDYHLGFQTDDKVAKFPLHAQKISSMLTLQGAIAHIDMPVESGPTRFLPYSQQYDLGFQLYRQNDFKCYFEENAVQLPLNKGDAVFFNPALMHGAGANKSNDIQRLAILLQISSPFGKAMEMVDHDRIQLACYEALKSSSLTDDSFDTLLTIMSDCYPFPTNLDRDTPQNSLTPSNSKELLNKALEQDLVESEYSEILKDYRWRRLTS